MIDLKDLNAIYDGGQDDGIPPKATPAGNKPPVDLGSLGETPSPVHFGTTSDVNVQDYNNYLEDGVYSDRPIDLVRGQKQSVAEKIGLRLANFVPNIVAGTAEMIGYTGALASEWGDDRDYSNAFTQAGAAMHDPFGKTYARSNDVFALSDPTWWIDNLANIAEVGVSFSGEVGLIGKYMGELAQGASKVFNAGQKTSRIIGGAAQLATAGFSAYTEAAMDGASVYDQTYKTQLQKQLNNGLDPEAAHKEATHLAAQSAATTVQLSTAMTTLLNLSSVAPFFKKSEDVVQDVLRNEVAQKVGETAENWAARIKSLKADDYAKQLFDHHGMGEFLKEMGQEGFEEVEQQFAQKTGEDEGQSGKTHGFLQQFGQFEHFFDRTMNSQGALAFVLGAAGGGLQTALIHHMVPSKRSTIDEAGNDMPQAVNADGTLKFDKSGNPVFTTKLVTPRTYDEWSTRKTFNTARDMVAEDVSNFAKMQSTYLEAVKKKDNVAADKARTEMFNVANINAITTGMGEAWKNTYQQIADYDNEQSTDPNDENGPTEAMLRGYASDRKDSEYKTKATEAIRDLGLYQKEYDKLQQRYGAQYEANGGIKSVVDMMFQRKVNLMANDKLIKHHDEAVKKMEQEQTELAKMSDPSNFDELEMNYDRSVTTAQEVSRRLVADHKSLVDAINKKDHKTIKELVAKYRAVGADDGDLQGAVNNLADKIKRTNDLQAKKIQQAEDNLFNGTGYQTWLAQNPTGNYQQYRELVHRKYALDGPTQQYRANVDAAKAEHEIQSSNYADAVSEKNVDRFAAKANKWQEQMVAEATAVAAQKQVQISKIAKDKATATRLQQLELGAIADKYKESLDTAKVNLQQRTEELEKVKEQLKQTSLLRDPLKYNSLRGRIKQLNKEITLLKAQILHYESLYNDHAVDTSTPDQDVAVAGVTDEDNDLPEDQPDVDKPDTPDFSTSLPVDEVVDTTMVPPQGVRTTEDIEQDRVNELGSNLQDDEFAEKLFPAFGKDVNRRAGGKIVVNVGKNIEFVLDTNIIPTSLNGKYPGIASGKATLDGEMSDGTKISWKWKGLKDSLNSLKVVNGKGEVLFDYDKAKINAKYDAELASIELPPPATDNAEDFASADGDSLESLGQTKTASQLFSAEMIGKPQQVIDAFNQIEELFRKEMERDGKIDLTGRRDMLVKDIVPTYIKKANAITLLEMLKESVEEEYEGTAPAGSGTTEKLSMPYQADSGKFYVKLAGGTTALLQAGSKNYKLEDYLNLMAVEDLNKFKESIEQQINELPEKLAKANEVDNASYMGSGTTAKAVLQNHKELEATLSAINARLATEPQGPPVDLAPPPPPIDPPTENAGEDNAFLLPEGDVRHAGKKIDNPLSIANSTINFVEGFDKSNNAFFKAADSKGLNTGLNPDILTPGKLNAGTHIRFEVDTEWDGAVNIDDKLAEDSYGQKAKRADKFSDYLLSDGTIDPEKIGDVPIKIIDVATGKKIGNVRREGWLMAKYPNTTDYLNFNNQPTEEGGETINDAREDLLRVRRFIVENHNNNVPVEGKISDKGMGLPILNRENNLNGNKKSVIKPELASNLLPDPKLEIGIVNSQVVYTSAKYPFDKAKGYDAAELHDGAIVVMLPGANGKHFYAPLEGHYLHETKYDSKGNVVSERKGPIQSVVRAIELYMLHDGTNADVTKEMDTIRNKTGFDISTAAGLRNFISQYYTYLDSFDLASIQPNAPVPTGKSKQEKFVFNITDAVTSSKGLVHAGRTYSGVYAKGNIINGKLNPEFVQILKQGFAERSRAVVYSREGIRGINSPGAFTEINYNAAGNWSTKTHDSYNDYVKSWSKTVIYGKNQLSNDQYVYTANPQMPFEVTNINQSTQVKVQQNTSPDTPEITTPPAPAENGRTVDEDVLDLIFGEMDNNKKDVVAHEIGTAPAKAKALTLANLEALHGTTTHRNGLTPQEVYSDLIRRGHSFLPEGYNPFSECV